jgi:tRNA-dihydrouridine synthase B
MKVGNLNIEGKVFCAPMAGISTPAYRLLARRMGAAVVYSEMISSNGLTRDSLKSLKMIRFSPDERPYGIQLFGADPERMNEAAKIVSQYSPDLIDLNFGCPVKKVVNKNGGAAVLKDLGLTKALIEAAVAGSSVPVTIKLRSGWDESTKTFEEAARIAQEAGAAAVTLHARTRSKKFSGKADWADIAQLKQTVSIPVIGNGDVTCGADARRMFDETGCDAIMIGRAALGNPWIFREINHFLDTGTELPIPSHREKVELILEHARMLVESEGERHGILMMRRNLACYTSGWPGGNELRKRGMRIATYADLDTLITDFLAGRLLADA